MTNAPLRYSPGIETPEPDEQETIDGIIAGMTQQSQTVANREHHTVRASHAKSTALVTGTLEILPDLPPELAQGLFATPGTHPVAARFAQGTGETLADRVSTHRGLSIKVFDVEGEKLPGHTAMVQDFLLASGPVFPSGTARGFLRDGSMIGHGASLPEGVKSAVSSLARNVNAALQAVGIQSPKADFFGHPFSHPLSEPYFSQAPLRYGDYVAKVALFPVMPELSTLEQWQLDPHEDENGFRHATVDFFASHDVVFEMRVQLWNNAETQPIEDASVEWKQDESPYRTVAILRLPQQDAYTDARHEFFDERLIFRPSHSLTAHQPLGSVMRARLQVYSVLSKYRHDANGEPEVAAVSANDIPA